MRLYLTALEQKRVYPSQLAILDKVAVPPFHLGRELCKLLLAVKCAMGGNLAHNFDNIWFQRLILSRRSQLGPEFRQG